MSRVIYEELQDKNGNVHYLHTEDKVVFDENGQSLRTAMKEVQFEDYTGATALPSIETAMTGIVRGRRWTELFGNIKAVLKGLTAKGEAVEGNMGDAFSEEKAYAAGSYVIYGDVLYKFTAAKSAGAWDAAKVQAVTVAGEVSSLNANIIPPPTRSILIASKPENTYTSEPAPDNGYFLCKGVGLYRPIDGAYMPIPAEIIIAASNGIEAHDITYITSMVCAYIPVKKGQTCTVYRSDDSTFHTIPDLYFYF